MKLVGELTTWNWEELKPIWRHHLSPHHIEPPDYIGQELAFVRQGNFTVCMLTVFSGATLGSYQAVGVAKRAASLDRHNGRVAQQIAFGRACAALARELAKEQRKDVDQVISAPGYQRQRIEASV